MKQISKRDKQALLSKDSQPLATDRRFVRRLQTIDRRSAHQKKNPPRTWPRAQGLQNEDSSSCLPVCQAQHQHLAGDRPGLSKATELLAELG